jgi:uncharacterized protein YndB with AHSA1/START domain
MTQSFEQTILINASAAAVWDALTCVERMIVWMGEPEMKLEIEADWKVGSKITIRGFHHMDFENTGVIHEFKPMTQLTYTQLSSLSRLPDVPDNHTIISFNLRAIDDATSLSLLATRFPTESIFKHLQFYWRGTLQILKQYVEQPFAPNPSI